jgi:hypothetical protein
MGNMPAQHQLRVQYVPGDCNEVADAISCQQFNHAHQEKPELLICENKFKLVRINSHQTDADLHQQISSDKLWLVLTR